MLSQSVHTPILKHIRLDGDFVIVPIEERGPNTSGLRYNRIPRADFDALMRCYAAMVHEEEDANPKGAA